MNRIQIVLFILGVMFFAFSCSGNDPAPNPELVVSVETLTFGNASETQTIHIKTNIAWNISVSDGWCTVSPASGNNTGTIALDVTVAANTTTAARNAVLTVSAGNLSQQITVTQDPNVILTISPDSVEVSSVGQDVTFNLQASPDVTSVTVDPNTWITQKSSNTFTIAPNPALFAREGTITFSNGKLSKDVIVQQSGSPLNIAADKTGMNDDAVALSAKLGVGWNLGNSLESTTATSASETMWGNPPVNKQLIDAVKAAGFTTIRIPCAWNAYIEDQTTYKIEDSWLARVKEVVDYCVDDGLYAIINIHWDGGWLEDNPTYAMQESVNEKQKALWEQIAVYFRDYDEHLMFAGTNEVHADYGNPTGENITVQMSFNQTFVDAVRSTGGRNTWRNLIIQSYNTNIDYAVSYLQMSSDATPNRMLAEVHYYDPYDFCLDGTSNIFLWGKNFSGPNVSTWGQEDWVDGQFGKMNTNFVQKGIPVILGEYAAILRTSLSATDYANHVIARNYFLNYVTKTTLQNGMTPIYWDAGATGDNSTGLFNRTTGEQVYPDAIQAIVSAK